MDTTGIHIRDHVMVDQALLKQLEAQSKAPILYVVARHIQFGEEDARIIGRNLVFIADRIRGREGGTLTVMARPLPPRVRVPGSPVPPGTGRSGPAGGAAPMVTFYCREFDGVRVDSVGATGGMGGSGAAGATGVEQCVRIGKQANSGPRLVCETAVPSPTGKRGGTGGAGGAGGVITVHCVTRTGTDVVRGVGGEGGPGGPGGPGGRIVRHITEEDGSNGEQATTRFGAQGVVGPTGVRGANVSPRFVMLNEAALDAAVRALLGGAIAGRWAQHRLRQGDFLFRSGTASRAGSARLEFDAAIRLAQGLAGPSAAPLETPVAEVPAEARRLRDFVASGQNVFGMPRRLQLVPHVENVLDDLEPYESLPSLMKQDAMATLLHASGTQVLRGYVKVQRDALQRSLDEGGSLALEIALARSLADESQRAKEALIERARKLRQELEPLRTAAEVEQMEGDDDGMIIPGVRNIKLFAIVAATIITVALPPAAAGTVGLVAATVVPQLPDLLLGEGSPTEQSLQDLASSGAAFASQLATRLQNIEQAADGIKRYAELYEDQVKSGKDPAAALGVLKDRLKQDFKGDISAAKTFALDFKRLQSDLQSVEVGPDKPKQTAFLAKARELAAVAHQAQAAIVAASQASLGLAAADARASEANRHLGDLQGLIEQVDRQALSLRLATVLTLHRAQRTMSLLGPFRFRLARALDLYTLASERGSQRFQLRPPSLRVPYAAGFVEPDLMRDYAESDPGDTQTAERLLKALASSFDDDDFTLKARTQLLAFRNEQGPRLSDVAHSVVLDGAAPELVAFRSEGRLRLRIPLEAIPFAYEAKVQNVQLILEGLPDAAGDPSTLNVEVVRQAGAEQRWHPARRLAPPTVTEHLLPGPEFSGRDNLALLRVGVDGPSRRVFSGASRVDETSGLKIGLQCFGRGVTGEWELRLSDATRAADLPRLAGLQRIELVVFYGAWVDAQAVIVQTLTHGAPLAAGRSAQGTVTLAFAPSTKPQRIILGSNAPSFVKVPDAVEVPVGSRSATFPISVDPRARLAAPRLFAQAANRCSTSLAFADPVAAQQPVPALG